MASEDQGPGAVAPYPPQLFRPSYPPNAPFDPRPLEFKRFTEHDTNTSVVWRALFEAPDMPRRPVFALDVELRRGDSPDDDERRFTKRVVPHGPLWGWFYLMTGSELFPGDPPITEETGLKRELGRMDVIYRPKLLHYEKNPGERVAAAYSGEHIDYLAAFGWNVILPKLTDTWTSAKDRDPGRTGLKAELNVSLGEGRLTRTAPRTQMPNDLPVAVVGKPGKLDKCVTVEVTTASQECQYQDISFFRLQ
jgi:hypothetical protein